MISLPGKKIPHTPPLAEITISYLKLQGVVHDGHDLVDLIGGELAGALVEVDVALLADQVGHAASDTLDAAQGVHHLLATIHVGVAHTQDVLKILGLELNLRHGCWSSVVWRGKVPW